MGMLDINTIADRVQSEADADANIIFGATISEDMQNKISVTSSSMTTTRLLRKLTNSTFRNSLNKPDDPTRP